MRMQLAWMMLVASCAKTAVTPTPERRAAADDTGASTSVPAFVVVTDGETIVAPVDPAIEPVRALGIWVLDEAAAPPAVQFYPTESEAFPDCACVDEATACAGPMAVGAGDGPVCGCNVPDAPPHEAEYDPENEVEEEGCDSSSSYPVSLVGGTLYMFSDEHDECLGRNIYGLSSFEVAMVDHAVGMPKTSRPADRCDPSDSDSEPPDWPMPDAPCDREDIAGSAACLACREMSVEASALLLHHGQLVTVEAEGETVGGGPRRWSSVPSDASHCPSAADTCGDATRFADLEQADDYWVANDGAHALRRDGEALQVLDARGASARGSIAHARVLGVRFHADARLLIATMSSRAPRARAEAQCSSDTDCAAAHRGCNLRCDAGSCVEKQLPALADADIDFVDERGGRDWGTRCIGHLRDARMANAQAACEAGLAIATQPAIRGALLYNLGLVAIETGDVARARARFRESLAVRPGNATVQRALERLPAQ